MKRLGILGVCAALLLGTGCQSVPSVPTAKPAAQEKSAEVSGAHLATPRIMELPDLAKYKRHLMQTGGYGVDPLHTWNVSIGVDHTAPAGVHYLQWNYYPTGDAAVGAYSTSIPAAVASWYSYVVHLWAVTATLKTPSEYKVVYQVPAGRVLIFQVNIPNMGYPYTGSFNASIYGTLWNTYQEAYLQSGVSINRVSVGGLITGSGSGIYSGNSPSSNNQKYFVFGPGDVVEIKLLDPRISNGGGTYLAPYYYLFYLQGVNNFTAPYFPLIDLMGYTATADFLAGMKGGIGVK